MGENCARYLFLLVYLLHLIYIYTVVVNWKSGFWLSSGKRFYLRVVTRTRAGTLPLHLEMRLKPGDKWVREEITACAIRVGERTEGERTEGERWCFVVVTYTRI